MAAVQMPLGSSVDAASKPAWKIERIQISGGFLPGLDLSVSPGLTCIIGPRGSGKSTFAEILRFVICGASGAPKERTDLLQANIGLGGLITASVLAEPSSRYTLKRGLKQAPVLVTVDGRTVTSVDLDRGSFFPLDAYSSSEIEEIAQAALGVKRRALLDELAEDQLRNTYTSISERKRALDANSDQIKSLQRTILDLAEQIEEIGDVRARLTALSPEIDDAPSAEYSKALKQQQCNQREQKQLDLLAAAFGKMKAEVVSFGFKVADVAIDKLQEPGSANNSFLKNAGQQLSSIKKFLQDHISQMKGDFERAEQIVAETKKTLANVHGEQSRLFSDLQEQHRVAGEAVRERAELEEQVSKLEDLEADKAAASEELRTASKTRATLKAEYLLEREQVSNLREEVAERLQRDAGGAVRIRVIRNGDDLVYRQHLTEALKGARVRNHEEILDNLMRLRPEQLAQFIQAGDVSGFDELINFGTERSRKILESFKENIDPLELEVIDIQDRVRIELNVSTSPEPIYKDAADLSRGQKCTALLPLLLARRNAPLIIDQPEDNLDNHFIYETVVNSIKRLKRRRQMIFITHNANIPVLAEADLVIVMNSDGKVGFVEKSGTVDECRNEIIDLLEGGQEAFDLRSKRYAIK